MMSERTVDFFVNLTSSIRFFLWSAFGVAAWLLFNNLAPAPLRIDDPKAWLFLNLWFGLFGYFQQILILHTQRRQDDALMTILGNLAGMEQQELDRVSELLRHRGKRRTAREKTCTC